MRQGTPDKDKELQTIIRSKDLGNYSTNPEMLTNMKAVIVTMQNVLVNANNFLCMRQWKTKSVRRYSGFLKGAARHCDFNQPMG